MVPPYPYGPGAGADETLLPKEADGTLWKERFHDWVLSMKGKESRAVGTLEELPRCSYPNVHRLLGNPTCLLSFSGRDPWKVLSSEPNIAVAVTGICMDGRRPQIPHQLITTSTCRMWLLIADRCLGSDCLLEATK